MKSEIKRPIRIYVYHGLLIYVSLVYGLQNSTDLGRIALLVMACVMAGSCIRLLIRRNYFEIKDKHFIICRNFSRMLSIKLNEISRVEIEPWFFIHSKIYLKDGGHIKYMSSMATEKEVKELMGQFNIPVE